MYLVSPAVRSLITILASFPYTSGPTQLKIPKPHEEHSTGSHRVPQSKYDANRFSGLWAMIGQTNRDYNFIYIYRYLASRLSTVFSTPRSISRISVNRSRSSFGRCSITRFYTFNEIVNDSIINVHKFKIMLNLFFTTNRSLVKT